MKHITLHIERLLLHNDYVIVPGLGGFVAQTCSARYVEEEDLFLPPYQSVSFNPRLTMNDGLLVHDIALYHSIEYRDALRIVENEVSSIREALDAKGEYIFHGIGTLRKTSSAHYEFEPITCGVSAPDLYGLDSYYISPANAEKKSSPKLQVRKQNDDTLTFRLPMAAVRYAAVAAVAAVFFFVCIAPLNTAIAYERSEAGMLHYLYSLFTRSNATATTERTPVSELTEAEIKPTNSEAEAATPAVETAELAETTTSAEEVLPTADPEVSTEVTTSPAGNQTEAAVAKGTTTATQTSTSAAPTAATTAKNAASSTQQAAAPKPYAIVVASYVTEPNAKAMIESWKKKGLPSATISATGKTTRIIYGTYETYEKAHEALQFFKKEFKTEFAEAWVYEIH